MKAVVIDGEGAAPRLREDLPAPFPGPERAVVRVRASSVNPVDGAVASGMLAQFAKYVYPVTLGRDLAGVIEEIGEGVDGLGPGDEVFGMLKAWDPAVHDGAWAEFVEVPVSNLVRKPTTVDFRTAGVAPLAAITAFAALDALRIREGEKVLILGASGGVGNIVVQLAAATGADVVAPGLPEDVEYLGDLGATEVPDRGAELAGGFDAIFDAVSYAPGSSEELLAAGGRLASPNAAAGEGEGRFDVMAEPGPEILARIAKALEDGSLKVPVQDAWDLAGAPAALEALGSRHTQGKLAIRID